MPDPLTVDIAVAIATLVAPAVFLALLAAAGWRRSRGLSVGPRWSAMVTVIGGVCLGLFLLVSGALLVSLPILVTTLVLWLVLVGRGAWRLAFWLIAGVATPWTVVSGIAFFRGPTEPGPLGLGQTWLAFLVGAGVVLLSLASAVIGGGSMRILCSPITRNNPLKSSCFSSENHDHCQMPGKICFITRDDA